MVAAPVVPKSLEEPVPKSQARSRVQRIIDADRSEVEKACIAGGERQLAQILARAEVDLRERLEALRAAGQGDSWTAADLEASLHQVRAAMAVVEPQLVGILAEGARRGRELGSQSVVNVLRYYERGANVRPLAVRAALALEQTVMERYQSSVARYGLHTIGVIRRELQAGVLVGKTFSEMTQKLAGKPGEPGLLLLTRARAETIVRTEAMSAYAQGAQVEIVAQKQRRFGDLKRKIIAVFDARTAQDSYGCHGEVRDINEEFEDGKGRRYLLPPARPRDREIVIPWRNAWLEDQPEEAWERTRTAAEAARMEAPEPPQPTAIED